MVGLWSWWWEGRWCWGHVGLSGFEWAVHLWVGDIDIVMGV